MDASYPTAIAFTLNYEGGKSNNPKDPGGKTNQGVTQNTFAAYMRNNKAPVRDVYTMTDTERDAIYRSQYWNMVHGDDLPAGVDMVTFDAGVNSGPGKGIKWLQQALKALGMYPGAVDSQYGNQTHDAAQKADPVATIKGECAVRLSFLHALKTFGTFGKGWTARVTALQPAAVKMALLAQHSIPVTITGSALPLPPEHPIAVAMTADKDEADKAVSTAATGAGVATGGAIIAGGVGAVTPELQGLTIIHWALIAGAVVLVIVAIVYARRASVQVKLSKAYADVIKFL